MGKVNKKLLRGCDYALYKEVTTSDLPQLIEGFPTKSGVVKKVRKLTQVRYLKNRWSFSVEGSSF